MIKIGTDKFVAQADWKDSQLKSQTVGLVKLEDFQRIRNEIEEKGEKSQVKVEKVKPKKRERIKLSFGEDEEDEQGNGGMKERRSVMIHDDNENLSTCIVLNEA